MKKLKEYTNIKELIESVEDFWERKVIDGWRENRYWVSVLKGDVAFVENKKTGEWKSYQGGCYKIRTILPI